MGVAPPRAALLSLLAASLALSGCGYTTPSVRDRARATAETFLESCARGEPAKALEVMSESLRASALGSRSALEVCARFLGIGTGGRSTRALIESFRGTVIEGVTLRGAVAAVRLRAPGGGRRRLELGFSEGEWLLDTPPAAA